MHRQTFVAALCLAAALEAGGGGAHAEMRVLDSTVPSIPNESVWPDDTVFDIPPGGHVQVLLQSKETRTFYGPRTGGRQPDTPTGATRGLRKDN
jgi:hypothetical protein